MFADLANSGPMPVLGAMLRFTSQRQKLIANNIANLDTPNYQQQDVSPAAFQAALASAIDRKRSSGKEDASLGEVRGKGFTIAPSGSLTLDPLAARRGNVESRGIAYHDRNNRDMEGLMQDLAENTLAFRLASDLYRKHNDILRVAITQRS
jgi:flagellar basal-body rod protein FlgB